MKLAELLQVIQSDRIGREPVPNLEITGIEEDSRRVRPGHLFIARSGTQTDGAKYVTDAAERGAVAAIVERAITPCAIPQFVVKDASAVISPLAARFYAEPSRSLKVIGITGTNGKTTTTYLIRHLLRSAGIRCGLIGTVEIDDGAAVMPAAMTTPSPIDVTALMAGMRDHGCQACAIEVSSHALDQQRVGAVTFSAAGFTNLTGDHLDYHLTMDRYADAKALLFEMLSDSAAAIVNARDAAAARMLRDTPARPIRFGIDVPEAEYRAEHPRVSIDGSSFVLHTPAGSAQVSMRLIGRHNIENALTAAACVAEVFGLTPQQIADGLGDAAGAPGRLQRVPAERPFTVFVDYAHTDDALQNVLQALRPLTAGKLRVLFGCGGNRDATKRPRMARVAQRLADAVMITSDNPRKEDPMEIIRQIQRGLDASDSKATRIEPDRRKAIEAVLADAREGDVILIAGKGHENYQIINDVRHHFDDVEEATKVLS